MGRTIKAKIIDKHKKRDSLMETDDWKSGPSMTKTDEVEGVVK
jgi:hypothetical protein